MSDTPVVRIYDDTGKLHTGYDLHHGPESYSHIDSDTAYEGRANLQRRRSANKTVPHALTTAGLPSEADRDENARKKPSKIRHGCESEAEAKAVSRRS